MLSESDQNGISARLRRLPGQFLLALINATAILVIWNASSSHYKRALELKESAYGERRCERPADQVARWSNAPGGVFVLHAKALPGNPYDGHTLGAVIATTETLTGCAIERAYVDKGYRGHDADNPRRVFISGQKRGVFGVIKRELKRRSAIEAVIGHMKTDGHLGRCYLKGQEGDAANTILTAVGHNLRLILAWLKLLLRLILGALLQLHAIRSSLKSAS